MGVAPDAGGQDDNSSGETAILQDESKEGEATGFLSPSKSAMAIGAAPTLTEVHADLLSFIAKKERKCLDLREGMCIPAY